MTTSPAVQSVSGAVMSRNHCSAYSTNPVQGEHNWTEFSLSVPWGHIAGKTYGDPKGSPVLAIHGLMDNCGTFDTLVPYLSNSLYIVAVDLPGHGLSSHLPQGMPYHYINSVIILRYITNHFQWKRFSWLGHSLGAGLGACFAAIFPTHKHADSSKLTSTNSQEPFVDRLVMLDLVIPVFGGVTGDYYGAKMSMAIDGFIEMEEKHRSSGGPPAYEYNEALQRLIRGTSNDLTVESAEILMKRGTKLTAGGKYSFSRDFRLGNPSTLNITHENCLKLLKGIRSSVLIIKAKNSSWYVPPEIRQQAFDIYKKNCPVFQFESFEGNHFLHLNEPEKLAGVINKFLAGDISKL